MKISVSFLSSYYSKLETIKRINQTDADYIHVDLMDGGFVPEKNFTINDILELLNNHEKPLDIHLMVFDPIIYIKDLATLKPEFITFHLEATKDIVKTISLIKSYNIKVGLSIKPDTNLLEIMPYLPLVDLVLVMSVAPGKGGQEFMEQSINRLEDLINYRKDNNLNYLIEVDGGINDLTINKIPNIDIVVSGSYICKSNNYQDNINKLKVLEKNN